MSFSANINPKDTNGNPIVPGWYRVGRPSVDAAIGSVFEAEDGELWILFVGQPRPQRIDELSLFCQFSVAEQSEIDAATNGDGESRSA